MAKFVYLVASHNNPEQIIRLVKILKSGSRDSLVLIHHDYSSCYLNPAAFEQISNVHILEDYVSVGWGKFSMIQMELHCINWLIANSIEFDWLIFLSGQDYPIKPLTEIEEFLEKSEYDGFMDHFLAKNPPEKRTDGGLKWKKAIGIRRYFYHYYKLAPAPSEKLIARMRSLNNRLINNWQPLIKLMLNKSGVYVGIRCFSTPFNPKFQCYVGSQWWTLSDRCIKYIHDFVNCNPAYVKYCQKTLIPDESFFQTILLSHPQLSIFNDNKRYICWQECTPTTLGVQDVEALITSQAHFARKFNIQVDTQVLDRLDQYLSKSVATKNTSLA